MPLREGSYLDADLHAVIDDLKLRRIIVPHAPLVERFALAGRAFARRHAHRELIRGLDAGTRQRLEALLTTRVWGHAIERAG